MAKSLLTIHIGRHKCGTSALQDMLDSSRQILGKAGWLYPETGIKNIAHHKLANYWLAQQIGKPVENPHLIRELLAETDGWPNVVLSSEAFQNIVKPQSIKDELKDFEIKIVVYLREQLEYVMSAYAQAVQARKFSGSLESFEATFDANYERFLTRWVSAFGYDAITVRIYDRKKLLKNDIISDFLNVIGLEEMEHSLVVQDAERNPSIGGPLLEFKRAWNAVTSKSEDELRDIAYKRLSVLANEKSIYRSKPAISPAFAVAVRNKYAKSNERVREQFFQGSKELFELRDIHQPDSDADWKREFDEIACKLCSQLPEMEAEIRRAQITAKAS